MYIYYIYAYINSKTGLPYYIGKGKGQRAYQPHSWAKTPKDKRYIVMLETNLSEIGALALERRYIKWYGRKDNGTGTLLNLTDGGEGPSGALNTPELRYRKGSGFRGKKRPDHSEYIRQNPTAYMLSPKPHLHTQEIKDARVKGLRDKIHKHPSHQTWICQHCGTEGTGLSNHSRWHGDNCKAIKCEAL